MYYFEDRYFEDTDAQIVGSCCHCGDTLTTWDNYFKTETGELCCSLSCVGEWAVHNQYVSKIYAED